MNRLLLRTATASAIAGLLLVASPTLTLAACNKAITISETQQMNYGAIAAASGGGRVTMSPSGTVTAPGGFALTGTHTPGTFNVSGTNGCTVNISFTPGSLAGPGAAMTINNFTTNAGATPTLTPAGGQLIFSVGADILVNAGQTGGNYSGTYTVTVIY